MQASRIWLAVAAAGAILFLAGLALFFWRMRPRAQGLSPEAAAELAHLPSTPLQRRAWWSLVIGLLTLAAMIVLLASRGVTTLFEVRALRLSLIGLFLAGIAPHVALLWLTDPRRADGPGGLDERDRSILSRAPRVQSAAVVIALGAWSIGLQEFYWDRGAIPIDFPFVIFMSTVYVQMLALAAGILLGYWSARGDAQG